LNPNISNTFLFALLSSNIASVDIPLLGKITNLVSEEGGGKKEEKKEERETRREKGR
jgi:hypothetical protein